MTKIQLADYFEQLNLSEIESKLYLTLLESGPITVRELAESIEMKRTTAYLYIDHLVTKGLVMKIVKGPHKLIAVVDPETSIENLVKEKLENAQLLESSFPAIMKSLQEKLPEKDGINDAEIKFYKGKNGVKKIYEEALSSKELRSYVNMGVMANTLPENAELFTTALKNNKDIKMWEIIEDSPESKEQREFQSKHEENARYDYKYLPEDMTLSATDTMMFDGNVAIINLRGQITGVVLHNPDYYVNARELFDLIWKILPKRNF